MAATNQKKTYYLGRGGRAHGPFSHEDFEKMRLSGEVDRYTYQWDESAKDWVNLDPKPPALGLSAVPKRRGNHSLEATEAVCHDHNEVVVGILENVTDAGCELVSDEHCASPKLALNSTLVLNVTNPAFERAMNVRACLSCVELRQGNWVYRLRWAGIPTL